MTIFHKTEVQTVIMRCLTGLKLDSIKGYELKCKYFHFRFFRDFVKKNAFVFFCGFVLFCVSCHNHCTNHDSDLFSTSKWPSESQFCERFHVIYTKMATNGCKMAIYQMQILMINFWFSQNPLQLQCTFCVIAFQPIEILTH